MKKSVTVSVDSEKLSALEMYLGQKNMKLSEELEKFAEQLYQKYVPSNVREFIELTASKKPSRRTKLTSPAQRQILLPSGSGRWVHIVLRSELPGFFPFLHCGCCHIDGCFFWCRVREALDFLHT